MPQDNPRGRSRPRGFVLPKRFFENANLFKPTVVQ
jgi:hypothetical protein